MTTNGFSRRTVLRTAVGAGATAALGATPAAVSAQSDGLSSWFSNTSNFDGVADETGQSEVTVTVGASGNGGNFAFGPAAIRVDPGTTVVWEWNGKGGSHNVVAEDGGFESEMTGESGHTFSQTFDSAGVVRYACVPHETMGMKGAVVVGGGGGSGGDDGGSEASGLGGVSDSAFLVGGSLLGALLSPVAVAVMLALGDDGDPPSGGRDYGPGQPSD